MMMKSIITNKLSQGKQIKIYLPIIFILIIAYVFFDVINTRSELRDLLQNEAANITGSIKIALKNNNESAIEIENYLLSKMLAVSYLTAHLEEHNQSDQSNLSELEEDFELDLILIFDEELNLISGKKDILKIDSTGIYDAIFPILEGEFFWYESGYLEIDGKNYYTIARERVDEKGAVLCGISSEKVLQIRKKYGIGALLQNFANQKDIEYIAIQDKIGIYAAAGNFSPEMNIITNEKINDITINNIDFSRVISQNNNDFFELVTPVNFENSTAVLRIAISTEKSSSIQRKTTFRAIILLIGLIFFYLFMIFLFNLSTKYIKLQAENIKFRNHLETILNNLNDAVLAISPDLKFEIVNNSALHLFQFDFNPAGKSYRDYFSNDEFEIEKSFSDIQPLDYKEIEINIKGEKKYIAFSHSFIKNDADNIELLIIVIKDITEIKQSQELIQRKNRFDAMANLAAGVAHEIRNPLNSISVIVQRFKLEFMPESDKEEYLKLVNIVRNEIARLNTIITQFLDYAKPKTLQIQKLNPAEIINELFILFKQKTEKSGINLKVTSCDSCFINADKDKLKQVFINLIQNSIDELENGGEIAINSKIIDNFVVIDFVDNGKGIEDTKKG